MNTNMKLLMDVTNILSSVSVIRKQLARPIATKCAQKFSYALPATVSTIQFGRMAVVARRGEKSQWLFFIIPGTLYLSAD